MFGDNGMGLYNSLIASAPQGADQTTYLKALGMGMRPQGAPQQMGQMSPQGASNGPSMRQRIGGALTNFANGGQQQGGNPFLAAMQRYQGARQNRNPSLNGQPPTGMPNQQGAFPGVQFGPNPMPQGMRTNSFPPPAPGQGFQFPGNNS